MYAVNRQYPVDHGQLAPGWLGGLSSTVAAAAFLRIASLPFRAATRLDRRHDVVG
jgi:hypothetical protein